MREFGIYSTKTGEQKIVFGYSLKNAFNRYGLDNTEWAMSYCEYID